MMETGKGLVAVAYLPHGTMILDPNRKDLPNPEKVQSLHSCCEQIGERIAALDPDLLILLTPHGLLLHQSLNIYQPGMTNTRASGNAEWNGHWSEYRVDISLDGEASKDLYRYLRENLSNVEGMLAFAGLSVPMRWGEVVPLHFVLKPLTSKGLSVIHRPQLVIIGQPAKGVSNEDKIDYAKKRPSFQMNFGRLLRSWCDESSKKIVVLISGDQSHTHPWSSDLPSIYQPDPSCFDIFPQSGDEFAKQFDEIICRWIRGSIDHPYRLDDKLLIDEAGKIETNARICGYVGSLTLQGMFENDLISTSIDSQTDWQLTDFVYAVPTYYGMMGALFIRNLSK